jgi:hypothetical protein
MKIIDNIRQMAYKVVHVRLRIRGPPLFHIASVL